MHVAMFYTMTTADCTDYNSAGPRLHPVTREAEFAISGFPRRMMNLWVAIGEGGAIASYNPMSGKQLAKVSSA